jgi:hypothetical protein
MRTQFGRSCRQSSRGDSGGREERSIRWQRPVDPFFLGFFRLPSGSASNAAQGKITAPPADVILLKTAVFAGFGRCFVPSKSRGNLAIGPIRSPIGRKLGLDASPHCLLTGSDKTGRARRLIWSVEITLWRVPACLSRFIECAHRKWDRHRSSMLQLILKMAPLDRSQSHLLQSLCAHHKWDRHRSRMLSLIRRIALRSEPVLVAAEIVTVRRSVPRVMSESVHVGATREIQAR